MPDASTRHYGTERAKDLPKLPRGRPAYEVSVNGQPMPKGSYQVIPIEKMRQSCQRVADQAVLTLIDLLSCDNPMARKGAATELLNRAYGLAPQAIKVDMSVTNYVDVLRSLRDGLVAATGGVVEAEYETVEPEPQEADEETHEAA